MKWSITYYYNIKYLKPNQLPLSTAMWPPKFFLTTYGMNNGIHFDKRAIILGLTAKLLVPQQQCECPCEKKDYQHCSFLKTYYEQLSKINFDSYIHSKERLISKLSAIIGHNIDEIVLLVYEKPDNPCSERTILKKWFKEHGIELDETIIEKGCKL